MLKKGKHCVQKLCAFAISINLPASHQRDHPNQNFYDVPQLFVLQFIVAYPGRGGGPPNNSADHYCEMQDPFLASS